MLTLSRSHLEAMHNQAVLEAEDLRERLAHKTGEINALKVMISKVAPEIDVPPGFKRHVTPITAAKAALQVLSANPNPYMHIDALYFRCCELGSRVARHSFRVILRGKPDLFVLSGRYVGLVNKPSPPAESERVYREDDSSMII